MKTHAVKLILCFLLFVSHCTEHRAQEITCEKSGLYCHDCKTMVMCSGSGSSLKPYVLNCSDNMICSEVDTAAACVSPPGEDDACTCASNPGYGEDPYDSSKFILCYLDQIVSQSCAEGEIYSSVDEECKKIDGSSNECTEAGFKEVLPGCDKYLVCLQNANGEFQSQEIACEDDEKFDIRIPGCETTITDPAAFTDSDCTDGSSGAFPDTIECNAFHICASGSKITSTSLCCPSGEVFSKADSGCVPDDGSVSCPVVPHSSCLDTEPDYQCIDLISESSSSSPISSSPSNSLSSSSNTLSSSTVNGSNNATTVAAECAARTRKVFDGDCQKFYYCTPQSNGTNTWLVNTCPGTTLFNPAILLCDKSDNVTCE